MASSRSMSDHLSCGVCMEQYDRTDHIPKILPCQHTFCLACLLSLERSSSSMSIECPMCRNEHEGSPHDFTTNRVVMDITEELQQQALQSPSSKEASLSLSCGSHADKDSVAVCIYCLTGICVKCVNKHKDHQLEDPHDAKTLLRDRFVNETRKEQSILQAQMAAALSVKEITRAEDDIKEMCTHLISVITKWQSDQLSIIGEIKKEVAKREQVLKAQNEKLESMVQNDNDISTLIRNLRKKDKVNHQTLQGNTYNFVAARDTILGKLTSVITSENLVKSKFLQNQPADAASLSTIPRQSAQRKPARQIRAGASQDRGNNKPAPSTTSSSAGPSLARILAQMFKRPEGSWECDTCMFQNKPGVQKCVACETPKPGAPRPTSTAGSSSGTAPLFDYGAKPAASTHFTFSRPKRSNIQEKVEGKRPRETEPSSKPSQFSATPAQPFNFAPASNPAPSAAANSPFQFGAPGGRASNPFNAVATSGTTTRRPIKKGVRKIKK